MNSSPAVLVATATAIRSENVCRHYRMGETLIRAVDGVSLEVRVEPDGGRLRLTVADREWPVEIGDPREWRRNRGGAAEAEGRQQVSAPMPGKIVRVLVEAGDSVNARQGLFVVEAMKMQNEIRSPKSGKVERLLVTEGQTVNAGEALAVII